VPRDEILNSFDELLLMPVFQFEAPDILQKWIASARESKVDPSDLLVTYSARRLGCESVITFDKQVAKSEIFEILKL